MAEDRQWAGTTYGNGWMHKYLVSALRLMDVRLLYIFTYVFIIPVVLVVNPSRKTSYHYFRNILRLGRTRSAWMVYVNHCRFAEVVIDKFAMYAGKPMQVTVKGQEHFDTLSQGDEGFVMLSSHIGNYEIAGYSLVSARKVIHPVVYAGEKESVMASRMSLFNQTNVRMILMRSDMSHLFEIDKALSGGEIVSFPTDRLHGSARTVTHDFLGKPASFPLGPFSVATMRGLNVLAVNTMKEGWTRYHVYVTPLAYDRQQSRKEQIAQLSKSYIGELEHHLHNHPSQWFNFYEFWQ